MFDCLERKPCELTTNETHNKACGRRWKFSLNTQNFLIIFPIRLFIILHENFLIQQRNWNDMRSLVSSVSVHCTCSQHKHKREIKEINIQLMTKLCLITEIIKGEKINKCSRKVKKGRKKAGQSDMFRRSLACLLQVTNIKDVHEVLVTAGNLYSL